MTLRDIIVHSSNIGTLLFSEQVGNDRLGVTGCFCAIAETGTLVVLTGADTPTATGWGGRVADLVNALNSSDQISMSISIAGKNTFQVGAKLPAIRRQRGADAKERGRAWPGLVGQ